MFRFQTAAAAAVLTLLTAPAAFAQAASMPGSQAPTHRSTANQNAMPAATSAESAGTNASAVIYESSPTPASQAYALKAGDPTVVSNAPIPDTRANRARFGQPLSRGGQRTAPAGN
ncbi:MAG TPA: hypothetical protein VF459_04080 [Caulobacteraceae bacterium]